MMVVLSLGMMTKDDLSEFSGEVRERLSLRTTNDENGDFN